ncbi:MAG: dTMP kinase [Fibromonadaceae bacterium]|nr:dTMP kinase [Fibromonadaceae bacterium]
MDRFICLEGIDGCGKSTQVAALGDFLEKEGFKVLRIREPGGTEISEAIRQVILNPEYKGKMNDMTELFLYSAARAQLIHEVVKPALRKGYVVLADRFAYSTLAYQGFGRGLDIEMVKNLLCMTCGVFFPNKTFIFDIPVSLSRERRLKNIYNKDRIEQEQDDFFERVRQGYLTIAKENPETCVLINAARSQEDIFEFLVSHLKD